MSILITGGSGLIGASLTQMIVELGERPIIFDVAPSPPILKKIDSKFKYFQGSLDHFPELLNIIKTEAIDTIFHLGGMLSLPSEKKPFICKSLPMEQKRYGKSDYYSSHHGLDSYPFDVPVPSGHARTDRRRSH